VSELLEEALASGQLELEEGGTGKLRMVEIISYKILAICRPEAVLESVSSTGVSFFPTKISYRTVPTLLKSSKLYCR
jgi:hypothetical protein